MNLYHLKTFYFTAKYKSLTKAAEFLCITQPAVTKQIKQLQSHYNLKFLDIIGKKVILTDAGLNLYTIAERIFDMESQAEEAIKDFQEYNKGKISILASESFGSYHIPYIIRDFKQTRPEISISIQTATNKDIIESISELKEDIGFISAPVQNPKISVHEILEDEIVLVASPNCKFTDTHELNILDLEGKEIIMHEQGSVIRKVVDAFLKKNKIDMCMKYEISNSEAIKKLVENNMGMAFLTKSIVHKELKSGELISIPVPDKNFRRKYYMIYHSEKYFSKPLKDFRDLIMRWSEIYPTISG
ncbi:MAG: LysR family transcriptional regulator [Spirochaetia bacterium]|nr:LysR family transcriptional regulator [Spirochaetia bacterium]MBR4436223.1 LysR family transcriptional regulator [Spirochaetales bacterium]MBR4796294.1 LysR family transcriptional regulator [Spirochaetia bacterium]MBR5017665.1 LysR family transcriptional regulator [Spirochaetia bacterium]